MSEIPSLIVSCLGNDLKADHRTLLRNEGDSRPSYIIIPRVIT